VKLPHLWTSYKNGSRTARHGVQCLIFGSRLIASFFGLLELRGVVALVLLGIVSSAPAVFSRLSVFIAPPIMVSSTLVALGGLVLSFSGSVQAGFTAQAQNNIAVYWGIILSCLPTTGTLWVFG
jgi:hypothetical protein